MLKAAEQPLTRNLLVLDSREAILALAPLLERLAERCGQAAAMHWLPYFLDPAVLGRRVPRLVLFLAPEESQAKSLTTDDLEAAALFFEYEIFGVRSGVVATADAVGFNSVIAPQGQRSRVAASASRALLERGARMLLATFDEDIDSSETRRTLSTLPGLRWACRRRRVARMLPLMATLDATLAQMGKSTRFNLRYYRRRLLKEVSCEFVSNAVHLLRDADLDDLNARSLNPVEPAEFQRRVASASYLPDSFLCGLRDADGRWLSLIGGWRQAQTTVLHWQVNASGYEKHSIGTVMRSFFLEAEILRGAKKLLIFGGTPHSMHHSFQNDDVADLVVERPGFRVSCLRGIARLLLSASSPGTGNFVAETLCRDQLEWHASTDELPSQRQLVFKPVGTQRAA